jgi:hypothetical protein
MNIQLGLVRACLGDGCRVRLLETEASIDVCVDRRVGDRTRLRYGQLAAVERSVLPALVWHWCRAQVVAWRSGSVVALLPEGRLVECRAAGHSSIAWDAVPEAWVTQVADHWEAHDAVVHGLPAHPAHLLHWVVEQPIAA